MGAVHPRFKSTGLGALGHGRKCMLSFGPRVQNGHKKARGRGYNCWSIRQKSHDQDWVHEDGANLQSGKLFFFLSTLNVSFFIYVAPW